jgi:hypothetical protein
MALNGRNQLSAMARRPATSGGVSLDRRTNVFTIPERVVSMPDAIGGQVAMRLAVLELKP